MPESDNSEDFLLKEYSRRVTNIKEKLKELQVPDSNMENKSLVELNQFYKDKTDEMIAEYKSLKNMKAQMQKQKQLMEQEQKRKQLEQQKEYEDLQTKEELKLLMNDIALAEKRSEPQTLPSPKEEPLLDDTVLEPIISYDAWGKKEFSMKKRFV